MTAGERIRELRALMRRLGEACPGTRVAELVGVSPSVVSRWTSGEVTPRRRSMEALCVLHRVARRAVDGHADGKKILATLLRRPGLARLGLQGFAIAAGLGWAISSASTVGKERA